MVTQRSDCGFYIICKSEKKLSLSELMMNLIWKAILIMGANFKMYSCTRLDNSIYKAYINRVFTYTTYGGAPRRDIVARELFPEKFPSNKTVKYKNLTKKKLQLLDSEIIRQSKWKIECLVVRSVLCKQYTTDSSKLCNYCKELQNDQFAKMSRNGSFKNKKIFEGLCHKMVQIADCEQHNKGLQNFKYSDQFSNFLVIFASLSPQTYNIFQQNLAGPRVKQLADTIKYTGPIIAMSDNTKIKERLGFFFLLGCIVVLTLSTELTRVFTHKDIYQVVETIKYHNAIAFQ
ncbi:10774_t:CDS:2, partial [Gigaspora margarita]